MAGGPLPAIVHDDLDDAAYAALKKRLNSGPPQQAVLTPSTESGNPGVRYLQKRWDELNAGVAGASNAVTMGWAPWVYDKIFGGDQAAQVEEMHQANNPGPYATGKVAGNAALGAGTAKGIAAGAQAYGSPLLAKILSGSGVVGGAGNAAATTALLSTAQQASQAARGESDFEFGPILRDTALSIPTGGIAGATFGMTAPNAIRSGVGPLKGKPVLPKAFKDPNNIIPDQPITGPESMKLGGFEEQAAKAERMRIDALTKSGKPSTVTEPRAANVAAADEQLAAQQAAKDQQLAAQQAAQKKQFETQSAAQEQQAAAEQARLNVTAADKAFLAGGEDLHQRVSSFDALAPDAMRIREELSKSIGLPSTANLPLAGAKDNALHALEVLDRMKGEMNNLPAGSPQRAAMQSQIDMVSKRLAQPGRIPLTMEARAADEAAAGFGGEAKRRSEQAQQAWDQTNAQTQQARDQASAQSGATRQAFKKTWGDLDVKPTPPVDMEKRLAMLGGTGGLVAGATVPGMFGIHGPMAQLGGGLSGAGAGAKLGASIGSKMDPSSLPFFSRPGKIAGILEDPAALSKVLGPLTFGRALQTEVPAAALRESKGLVEGIAGDPKKRRRRQQQR